MSSPRAIIQILITGSQIFGKALVAAGRQAAKNAKTAPQAAGGDVAGVGNATTGSLTDKLTREHRMTLDEAQMILNVKNDSAPDVITRNYEHLFKANSPPAPPTKDAPPPPPRAVVPAHSHYLQSKVIRALERLKAEQAAPQNPTPGEFACSKDSTMPPPPDSKKTS